MAIKPILFSGPMIRALLDGRKTQTRRLLKPQPPSVEAVHNLAGTGYHWLPSKDPSLPWRPVGPVWAVRKLMGQEPNLTPPYAPGDLLWVREAHYLTDDGESEYAVFAADQSDVDEHLADMQATMASHPSIDWSKHLRLRPSIHMPRWASRLTLRVTDVRVQRLQEISRDDCVAEGCKGFVSHDGQDGEAPEEEFRVRWDSLDADRAPWADNPWVAAYTFEVHKCNVDQMEAAT